MDTKPLAIILIVVIVINLILLIFRKISSLVFFMVAGMIALAAWKILPWLGEKL